MTQPTTNAQPAWEGTNQVGCIISFVTNNQQCNSYYCCMNRITPYEALKQMRALSDDNVPFSFTFWTHNSGTGNSDGVRVVERALLRTGLPTRCGIKSDSLIGFVELPDEKPRWFYLALLKSFNQIELA